MIVLTAKWFSHNRKAQVAPNPMFPTGVDLDIAGDRKACTTTLDYPAECCGVWLISCALCGTRVAVTAAGRRDDPRSVKVACKPVGGPKAGAKAV